MKLSSVLMFISKLPNWDVMSDSDFSSPDAESLSISPENLFAFCGVLFFFRLDRSTFVTLKRLLAVTAPWAAIGIEFCSEANSSRLMIKFPLSILYV